MHTMEYEVVKTDLLQLHAAVWMKLSKILSKEIRESKKITHGMIDTMFITFKVTKI